MDREEWLALGRTSGWVGPPVCTTHDGTPTTAEEDEDVDLDLCIWVLRVYENDQQRSEVEKNHSPTRWRS